MPRTIIDFGHGCTVWRVPISLPCNVPVLPGTPDCSAPIDQRTERCAVDAYWMVGRAMVCDHHIRGALEDDMLAVLREEYPWVEEPPPWAEMTRYAQEDAWPRWDPRSPNYEPDDPLDFDGTTDG